MIYSHLAAAALAAALACAGTWQVQDWRYGSREEDRLEGVRESTRMAAKVGDVAATKHEADKVSIRTEFITITEQVEKIIERPVYRDNVCLDADGLRILTAATRPSPAASKPASPVP